MNKLMWLARRHATGIALWSGIALGGVALLANNAVVQPLQEQQQALEAADELGGDGTRSRAAAARAGTPAQQLADFYAHFEHSPKLTELLARLNSIAKASGLELASAEYRLSSSGGEQRLLRYQVVLPVSGSYKMIRVFVARALRELPTMSLDLVQLERETIGDTTVEAQISFTFHLPR